ncbi:peroxiredoxin [uncultured Maricaulis sp.]|uniref:peroxiredoxin n=1 Tax=uncultured Maricaulis sp. TaxID=174710 RepID=UPI0025F1C1FF|nr:peroxiredoxin [uncultured Maricaulis sp.]
MRRQFAASLAALALTAAPALAELDAGDAAADFTVSGFQAGEPVSFHLAEALEEGPVVLFFFPAAFTSGCEAQAAAFAEAIDQFTAEGARVIGVTGGNTDRLAEFSTQHCASAFPVFAAEDGMARAYDARMMMRPGWTNRTSYVIDQNSTIAFSWSDMSPYEHVDQTLAAVRALNVE